jgi:hypothetical protein
MATYYKAVRIRKPFGVLFDHKGEEVNERERGLDEPCSESEDKKHHWLMLPFEEGQKEYVKCLRCFEVSHL